jgi:predicted AAA+ superfamily ATPase
MSISRDVTLQAEKYLDRDEALLFIGARQAGKTTILRQLESIIKTKNQAVVFLNLEDREILTLLNQSVKNLFQIAPIDLKAKTYIFVDEIQYLKDPTNFIKYFFDEYRGKIKIIASGSSAFYVDRGFRDSLVGRKKIFTVYTLSFREFLRFNEEGTLSIKAFPDLTRMELDRLRPLLAQYLAYGGYPRVVLTPMEEKRDVLNDILYSYIKKDIYEAGIRGEDVFYKLFKALAQQTGNLVNNSELATTLGVSQKAIDNYLYVMRKSFHIELVRPFYKNIRKEITKMPKVYFHDLGLRNAILNNFDLYETRPDKGQILENLFFRALLDKTTIDEIRFWRTAAQNEIDFVVGNKAYEIKSNKQSAKLEKYKIFQSEYPEIGLEFIDLNDMMSML